jgi:cell wall-associated NlpC family hydrolase
MSTWFSSEERIDALVAEASSWLGTPFRANAAFKGSGVCCHLFVAEVFMATGAVLRQEFPKADPNHSVSQTDSLIEPFMAAMPGFVEVDGPPLPGDILGFRIGGCTHHLAIVLRGEEMIHAVRRHGVMINRWDDPMWAKRLTRVWRLKP